MGSETGYDEEAVIHSGYLHKKGGSKQEKRGQTSFTRRNWKRRRFELRGFTLRYFQSDKDSSAKGELDLRGGQVREFTHETLQYCFAIRTSTRPSEMLLHANTEAEMRKWLDVISDGIRAKNPKCGDADRPEGRRSIKLFLPPPEEPKPKEVYDPEDFKNNMPTRATRHESLTSKEELNLMALQDIEEEGEDEEPPEAAQPPPSMPRYWSQ